MSFARFISSLPLKTCGRACLASPSLFFLAGEARAATIYWDGTGTGWGSVASWSTAAGAATPDPSAVPVAADTAIFGASTIAANQLITLDAARAATALQFTTPHNVTFSGGAGNNTLTLGASGITLNAGAGAVTFNASALLEISAGQSWTNNSSNTLTVNGSTLTKSTGGAGTLTVTGTGNTAINSVIGNGAGTVALTKSGAGMLTLGSGANTYTGITTVSGGTLSVGTLANGGVASGLGQATNAATNLVLNNGTLQYTGATVATDRNFTITNGTTGTIDVSNAAAVLTLNGGATNTTGALTKTGAGTLVLTGANANTGATTISAGTLQLGASDRIANTSNLVLADTAGAIFNLNGFNETVANLNGGGTTGGNITLGAGTLTTAGTGTNTYGGVISGTGGLTRSGASGSLTLSGANTYAGTTTISGGTLIAASNTALGTSAGGTTVAAGALLGLQGGISIANEALSLSATSNAVALRNFFGDNSYLGQITLAANAGIQTDSGSSLTLDDADLGSHSLFLTNNGTTTISGAFAGVDGSLIQNLGTTGTLIISETGSYTRNPSLLSDFTVPGGSLLVNGTLDTGVHGRLTIGTNGGGATLGGRGTITLGNNGINFAGGPSYIMPGAAPGEIGTLTLNADLNLNSYVRMVYDLGNPNNSDKIILNDALGSNAGALLNINAVTGFAANQNYTLIDYSGGSVPNPSLLPTLNLIPLGYDYTLNNDTTNKRFVLGVGDFTGAAYWDGSGSDNTTIQGGAGTWNATNTNWTTSTGVGNGAWVDNLTPIFQATAGTVTVAAPVSVHGMTFNTTGYTLTGSTITLGDATPITTNVTTTTIASTLAGSNGLAKSGTGTLVLTGTNNVTGGTTINAGTLQIGNAGTTGSLGAGDVTNNGTLAFNRSDTPTVTNNISGTGALTKAGGTSSTLTLSGNSSYSGATTITSGTLVAASATALGSTAGGTTVTGTNAALALQGNIAIGAEALSLTGTGVSSAGALVNNSGANTFGGAITLAGATTIGSTAGTLTLTGGITGTQALTFAGAGNIVESGVIGIATGAVTKTGAGTVTFSGANTYSGATTISGGTLIAAHNNALGTTAGITTIGTGATLGLSGGVSIAENLMVAALATTSTVHSFTDGNTLTGNMTVGSGATIGAFNFISDTGTLTLANTSMLQGSSVFSGAGNVVVNGALNNGASSTLVKNGSGTVTLNGASGYSGATTVNGGTLHVANTMNTSTVTVNSGAAVALSNNITLTSGLTLNSGSLVNVSGNNIWDTTTVTVTGASTFNSGASASDRLTIDAALTHSSATTTTFDGAGTTEIIGQYSGSGVTTVKQGTGTVIFHNQVTGSGDGFNLNAGTAVFEGTGSNNKSTINVNSGATIAGTGAIKGDVNKPIVIVHDGGHISPGSLGTSSVGTLTFGSNAVAASLTIAANGQLDFNLGTSSDLILFGAAANTAQGSVLTLDGGKVNVHAGPGFTSGTSYTLIDYNSNVNVKSTANATPVLPTLGLVPLGYDYAVTNDVANTNIVLTGTHTGAAYWDGANTTTNGAVDGGTSTWNATDSNWATSTGNGNGVWANNLKPVFQGTAGTVTVAAPVSAHGMTFNTAGYTLTGSTITLGDATPINTSNAGTTAIGSIIAGTNGLSKTGAGTLALSGANTYTGPTNLNAGALQVGVGGVGTTGSGLVTSAGSTTLYGTGQVSGAFTALSGSSTQAGDGLGTGDFGTLVFAVNGGVFDFQSGSQSTLNLNPGGSGDLFSFNGGSGGSLAFSGNLAVTAPGFAPTSPSTFNLLDWTGPMSSSFANRFLATSYSGLILGNGDDSLGFDLPDVSGSGYGWDISQFSSNGSISLVQVPEPSAAMLALLGGLGLVRRRGGAPKGRS